MLTGQRRISYNMLLYLDWMHSAQKTSIDFGMSRVLGGGKGICSTRVHGRRRRAPDKKVLVFGAGIVDNTATHVRSGFERFLFSFFLFILTVTEGFHLAFDPSRHEHESQRLPVRGFKLNSPWDKVWQITRPMGICGATYGKSGEMSHVNRE